MELVLSTSLGPWTWTVHTKVDCYCTNERKERLFKSNKNDLYIHMMYIIDSYKLQDMSWQESGTFAMPQKYSFSEERDSHSQINSQLKLYFFFSFEEGGEEREWKK